MKHLAHGPSAAESFISYRQQRRSCLQKRRWIIVYLSFLVAALQGVARGAALELYETGAPDLGTASAGRTAMAADASTAAANPAGMTLLDRSQLMTASGALLPSTNFDVAPETTTKGTGGGNAGVFMPIGALFYVYKYSERISLGVAAYSDYGLAGNYSKQWVGRYYITRASLFTSKIAPSIAYKLTEWLSVGAGFSFAVGRLEFQSKVNNVLPRFGDGGFSLESWDEAFGGSAGILLRPIPKLRIGLTYQSPEYFKFGFKPYLTGLGRGLSAISKRIGGVQVNVPLTEPQQVMASALYEVLPNFSLMGNVGWQNWAEFGEFPVGISATNQKTVEANLHFSNTCQIAVGQQFRFAEKWLWSAGFAYDSSPVSQANRNAVLPIDRQLRYGTGLQYEVNRNVTAGAAWEFMDAGPGPFSNTRGPLAGTLQGHYSTNYLNFLALNLSWKF
jgi:long-chain fatty acid transport protein